MGRRRHDGSVAAPLQARLTASLRRRIVEDFYAPAARLPSQSAMMREFRVSSSTVQMAVKQLVAEGFVESRGRSGHFVAANPPHRAQLGLVFSIDPTRRHGKPEWSRFYRALTLAATDYERETGRRIVSFHGVDWHTDTTDYARLRTCIETQQFSGVLFANSPFNFVNSPILDTSGMPRVAFEGDAWHPHVVSLSFRAGGWLDKALDYLAAQGRRKVASIEYHMSEHRFAELESGLPARGMSTRSCWRQFVSLDHPETARHVAELLMFGRERPDALLIEDDNFVEPALVGLTTAGVRVPDDLLVIGHANYPLPPAKMLPIRLLGYDLRMALDQAVGIIDRWRQNDKPCDLATIPALWEDELDCVRQASDATETRIKKTQ